MFSIIKKIFGFCVRSVDQNDIQEQVAQDMLLSQLEKETDLEKKIAMLLAHITEYDTYFVYFFDPEKNYYIQATALEGNVMGEIVSNDYLSDEYQLSPLQIERLIDFGWKESDQNFSKNWDENDTSDMQSIKGIAQELINAISVYQFDNQCKPEIDIG